MNVLFMVFIFQRMLDILKLFRSKFSMFYKYQVLKVVTLRFLTQTRGQNASTNLTQNIQIGLKRGIEAFNLLLV